MISLDFNVKIITSNKKTKNELDTWLCTKFLIQETESNIFV